MAVSPHFNHYNDTQEQNLIESLVVESIYMRGIDVAYIPRTQDNIDYLYNEDPTSSFGTGFAKVEMWPAFVDGFEGEGEMMARFGLELKKTGTFIVAKSRFSEEFPQFERPREGDLLFMPITNAVLEIKYVEHESPFFEKGKQYVYELKVETFNYSYEDIETGDQEIDDVLNIMNIDDPNTEMEDFGKNDDIETDADPSIEFDPSNPFGVR